MGEVCGRVAVVTGGGSGIGRAIALELARQHAAVAVADIVEMSAVRVAQEIVDHGGRAVGFGCDVSDRASVRDLEEKVCARLGPTSVLIANAGVTMFKGLFDMSDDDLDWIIQVNLFGVLNCVRAFAPQMVEMREGHVVAISSQSALLPSFGPPQSAYTAAKSGVVGLMLAVRHELEPVGVGATVVCPGRVATHITDSPRYRPQRFGGPQDASISLPLQRGSDGFRPPEDMAKMVLRAIKENEALVVSDHVNWNMFERGYIEPVRAAFDAAAVYDSDMKA